MRFIYSLLLYLLSPAIFLRLLIKGRKMRAYRLRWQERLGFVSNLSAERPIWIHAASVGETLAAIPLIQAIQAQYSHQTILLTTMTPTGSEQASRYTSSQIKHVYVPYDFPIVVKRFLGRVNPRLLIVMETELWPNILYYTHQRQIPILIANARLSLNSAKGYRYLAHALPQLLAPIQLVAAQTEADAERFHQLGVPFNKIGVIGNIKFDIQLPQTLIESAKKLRDGWQTRPVWIAASTHPGEEDTILTVFQQIKKIFPNILLILVPRHPQRFGEVYQLCERQGYRVSRRSLNEDCTSATDIFLGDTMGELFFYYALADIAFVGGSLVNIGGHNMLEPAALGLPVLTGPYLANFTKISELLTAAGAAKIVQNKEELAQAVIHLLQEPATAKEMGLQGQRAVEANSGAVAKHLEIIKNLM